MVKPRLLYQNYSQIWWLRLIMVLFLAKNYEQPTICEQVHYLDAKSMACFVPNVTTPELTSSLKTPLPFIKSLYNF